jgi:hypothetical protein
MTERCLATAALSSPLNKPLLSEAEIFLSLVLFKPLSDQGPSESPEPLSREAPR